jgi:hypothetical protein
MAKLLEWLRHFLVPHQSNNHRARILHPSVLTVVVAFFLVYQFGINFALILQPSILGFASNITPTKVIELTNQERLSQGLAPLSHNPTLSQAAQMKAGDMFAFNYWSHNSPSGRDPWSFFKEAGYRYSYAGENLARDFMNSEAVVQAWMNSPTHKENIVNGKYQEIGLAVVNGTLDGVETTLVVQLFGTPTPAPVAQKPPSLVGEAVAETKPLPTATPQIIAEVEEVSEQMVSLPQATLIQAESRSTPQPLLSPFALTKTVAVLLLGIILGVLALDIVLVYQKKIVRLSGKNVAHLIFVGTLLLAIILTTPGAIL